MNIIWMATATAAGAFLVTRSHLFSWLRKIMKSIPGPFGELFSCGYCLSHWIAGFLVIAYDVRILDGYWPLDYLVSILVVAWVAAFEFEIMSWICGFE